MIPLSDDYDNENDNDNDDDNFNDNDNYYDDDLKSRWPNTNDLANSIHACATTRKPKGFRLTCNNFATNTKVPARIVWF